MEIVMEEIRKLFAVQEIQETQVRADYINNLEKFFLEKIHDKESRYDIESIIKNSMNFYTNSLESFLKEAFNTDEVSEKSRRNISGQLTNQMNAIINVISNYNIQLGEKDFVDFLLKCADLHMSCRPLNSSIMQNDAIDLLRQFSDNNQLSEEQKERFEQIIQKIQEQSQIDFDAYGNIFKVCMEKNIPFGEKNIPSFLQYIMKLRNFNGILPEEYCDYFLLEALGNLPTLGQMLKDPKNLFMLVQRRAFEDKSRHVLKAKGIENYRVRIFPLKDIRGYCSPTTKQIVYGIKFKDFNISDLDTLFHETEHAYQNEQKEKGIIDSYMLYRIRKEDIIKEEDPEFYQNNYKHMYEEIDARSVGEQEAFKFMERLYDIWGIEQTYRQQGLDIHDDYAKEIDDAIERGENKQNSFGTTRSVDQIFANIIARKPSILEEYPEFLLEFNQDGSKKKIITMLKEYESLCQSNPNGDHREYIYDELFKSRVEFLGKEPLQDIEQLLQYELQSEKGNEYRNVIIINSVIPSIKTVYEQAFSVAYSSYMVLNQNKAQQWEYSIEMLKKFMKEHPEDDISVTISNAISPMVEEIQNSINFGVLEQSEEKDGSTPAMQEEDRLEENFHNLSQEDIQQGYSAIKNILSRAKEKIGNAVRKIRNGER